jgi:tetratricopeptide (TPR) repeat protein
MPVAWVVLAAGLAGQPALPVRATYLDAVRRYGAGTERDAVLALRALPLSDPAQVFDALDRACVDEGARSCAPRDVLKAAAGVRERILLDWRRIYPRVLAIHIEALVACNPVTERDAMAVHRNVVLRLIARLEDLEQRGGSAPAFTALAATARHMLMWALQYQRDTHALAGVLDTLDRAVSKDVELLLARAYLEEMRAAPEAVAATVDRRNVMSPMSRDVTLALEETRQLHAAARVYEQVLAIDGSHVEANLRLARVHARLGRLDSAQTRLHATRKRRCDRRQQYLVALFLADVLERRGHRADAKAAYASAQDAWPDAQAAAIGLARLRALEGSFDEARAAMRSIRHTTRPDLPLDRSDPWLGYEGGQAWQLPDAMRTFQATLEPLR